MNTNKNKIAPILKSDSEYDKKNKRKSLLVTSILYAILIILFITTGLTTPLPLPEEQGHFVLVGEENVGGETVEPEEIVPEETEEPVEPIEEEIVEEEVVEEAVEAVEEMETSNDEEAPEVNVVKEEKPVEKVEEKKEPTKPVEKEVEKEEVEEPKPKNPFIFNKSTGSGENEKSGTEGKENGVKDGSTKDGLEYRAKAQGGDGISFNLGGRSIQKYPAIKDDSQESAIVVVEILVDNEGRVISVRAGVKGSTTTDANLLKKAEIAAKQTIFNKSPNGSETQSGTMTFNFKLQ